jgi:hypothetical protein
MEIRRKGRHREGVAMDIGWTHRIKASGTLVRVPEGANYNHPAVTVYGHKGAPITIFWADLESLECTHGGDCSMHPDAGGPHDFDRSTHEELTFEELPEVEQERRHVAHQDSCVPCAMEITQRATLAAWALVLESSRQALLSGVTGVLAGDLSPDVRKRLERSLLEALGALSNFKP